MPFTLRIWVFKSGVLKNFIHSQEAWYEGEYQKHKDGK